MTKNLVKVGLVLGLLVSSASFVMADDCSAQFEKERRSWQDAVMQLSDEKDALKKENAELKKKLNQKSQQKKAQKKKSTQQPRYSLPL